MLTPPDESFTHQAPVPHSMVGSSDPSWRERYWVSLQDVASGETVLSFGLGHYPNQDAQEAFVCLSHEGRQHNLRLSRPLAPESHVMRVGPFSTDIVEPFQRLRFALDENASDISFELDWLGSFPPFLEDRHLETSGARVTHDLIRYIQVGRAEGHLRIGGHDLAVTPATWWGERDHSWGVRPLPRVEGSPPTARPEWSFLLFLPLQFEDFGFHLYLFEDRDGHATHRSCGLMEAGGAGREHVARLAHDLVWETDAPTPTLVSGSLDVELRSGRRLAIDLTALPGRAHLRGGGYGGVDGWFQGQWRDGETLTHEVWDLSDRTRLRSWGAYSSDHLLRATCDGRVGFGISEYMVLPNHIRYGAVRG